MTLSQHVVLKLFSGRWIWAVSSAFVFSWLACTNSLDSKDVMVVIGMVIGYYFGKASEKKDAVVD